MKQSRRRATFELTLAGVSTALAVIFLVIAYYVNLAVLACYALAGISLCLPLYVDSLRSCALSYVATSLLGFLFSNYLFMMPFILIFGLHIIVFALCKKFLKNKWYFAIPIKVVFVNLALFGVFSICGLDSIFRFMESVGIEGKYLYLALIGTPLFIAYDFLFQGVYSFFGRRLDKFFSKYRAPSKEKKTPTQKEEDPFDFFESDFQPTTDNEKVSGEEERNSEEKDNVAEEKENTSEEKENTSEERERNTEKKKDDLFEDEN